MEVRSSRSNERFREKEYIGLYYKMECDKMFIAELFCDERFSGEHFYSIRIYCMLECVSKKNM